MITSPIVPLDNYYPCEDHVLLKIIVDQKATIMRYIGTRRYSIAKSQLDIVKPLWSSCGLASLYQQIFNHYQDMAILSGHITSPF